MSTVAIRQNIPLTEEFTESDFSRYTLIQSQTTGSSFGRTGGTSYPFGLSTQQHIDLRTFNANTSRIPENWTTSVGTLTLGPQVALNNWLGLSVALPTGLATMTSVANSINLIPLATEGILTLALPNFPRNALNLSQSSIVLTDVNGATGTLLFASSITTLVEGNSTVSWSLTELTNDLAAITEVQITLDVITPCTFVAMALRLINPSWVQTSMDMDTWNQELRQSIPINGATTASPVANNQVLPPVWYTAATGGQDDPQPQDVTIGVLFNTGTSGNANSFSVNLRAVGGTDTSQFQLDGVMQMQLDGPQPGLVTSAELPRTIADLEGLTMAELNAITMLNLDAVQEEVVESWIAFTVNWGTGGSSVSIVPSANSSGGYQWPGASVPTLSPHTYYLAQISLVDTQARLQIYNVNQVTFAVGSLFFDTTVVSDSYQFPRRAGRVGWQALLGDGDASIRSIRPMGLVFAEYRSIALNSVTPVQGVRIYSQFTPDTILWQSWEALVGGGTTPTVVLDLNQAIDPEVNPSYRVSITNASEPGQGLISNPLSPMGDTQSGIVDFSEVSLGLSVWFSSATLEAGSTLGIYLLSQDGNLVPLSVPVMQPNHWHRMDFNPPANLPSGIYQMVIIYEGDVAATFWVDGVEIVERAVDWSARANPTDPWTDLGDNVNSDTTGVTFGNRGTSLQVRAQARRQDATIYGSPKVVPIYATLGQAVWPENIPTDTIVLSGAPIWPSSVAHNVPATFKGFVPPSTGITSTPAGAIIGWEWSFGDGTLGVGPEVQHTYTAGGSYYATLTVIDNYGTHTVYNTTLGVS